MSTQANLYDQAAKVIQRVWRKHVNVTVFQYLKSLISRQHHGIPHLLLKYVNPREANILDAAAGVYIRFRLGGIAFPPKIYYKIFTHRPVVDLCAYSPKDYTNPRQKTATALQTHNRQPLVPDDHSGWYHRVENNGWRLLFDKVSTYGDLIIQGTSSEKTEFHYCKLIRQQDINKKKKLRKIEWMKKMYDEGMLHARSEHTETAVLVKNSIQGMMYNVEHNRTSSILDWEVDELIEWTNALNFDEYVNTWKNLGTSKSSVFRKECFLKHRVPCVVVVSGIVGRHCRGSNPDLCGDGLADKELWDKELLDKVLPVSTGLQVSSENTSDLIV